MADVAGGGGGPGGIKILRNIYQAEMQFIKMKEMVYTKRHMNYVATLFDS